MSDLDDPFAIDPARRRILAMQDEARSRHEDYLPTPEALRLLLQEACEEIGSVDAWALRLGCKPAFLSSVLDGRRRAGGDALLDAIGLEWLPSRGVYSDPLLDSRAATQNRYRVWRDFANAQRNATQRILRSIHRENVAKEMSEAEHPPAAAPAPAPAERGLVVPFRQREDLDDPFAPDPARTRIASLHRAARARGEDYTPTADALRDLMREACPEAGGAEMWAMRLGCTPEQLHAVLDGRERPAGDMLDGLGLEYVPEIDAYADPLLDRRAQREWRARLAGQRTASGKPFRFPD